MLPLPETQRLLQHYNRIVESGINARFPLAREHGRMTAGPYVNGLSPEAYEEPPMPSDDIDLVDILQKQATTAAHTERHLDEIRQTTRQSHELHQANASTLGTINNHLGELVAIERSKAQHRAELERQRQAAELEAQKDRRKLYGQVVLGVLGICTTLITGYAAFAWGSQSVASTPSSPSHVEAPSAYGP